MTFGTPDGQKQSLNLPGSASQLLIVAVLALCGGACGTHSTPVPPATNAQVSHVQTSATADGLVIDTEKSEFVISSSGYIAAKLNSGNQKLSLDDPGNDSGMKVAVNGKQSPDVVFDVAHAQISAPHGRLGTIGRRIEVAGKDASVDLQEKLIVEV